MSSLRLIILTCAFVACNAGAPLYNSHLDTVIPGEYVVKLKEGSTELAAKTLNHLSILNQYNIGDWRALHVKVEEGHYGLLAEDSNVEYLEVNHESFHIACEDQPITDAGLWGLRRIAHRDPSASDPYLYDETGVGVNVYVLDTGIRITHEDFGGRASLGHTEFPSETDGNGHGTHCAGTIGGAKHGVAKEANLIAVKVLSDLGSGTLTNILNGIAYVVGEHSSGDKSVMNLSLGMSSTSPQLREALENAIAGGIHAAVAAGNDGRDACNYSPAEVEPALTTAASTSLDALASYSNIGRCVDIVAPGSNVLSTWHTSDTATNTISGTSMAAPHVAGWVARYLETNSGTPAQVKQVLQSTGTVDRLSISDPDTPNILAYRSCPEA